MDKVKIAIEGSRNFGNINYYIHEYSISRSKAKDMVDRDYIKVEMAIKEKYNVEDIELVVSGGAEGVNTLAEVFANSYSLNMLIIRPEWDRYGKKAGFIKNPSIITNCDVCFAFWDRESEGTKNSIETAKKQNKILYLIPI